MEINDLHAGPASTSPLARLILPSRPATFAEE